MLAARGAAVLDADAIVHDLQRPGTPTFDAIVDRFGSEVVGAAGELDRASVAALVFADEEARADLNAIVHPAVWEVISAEIERLRSTGRVVVLDVPLLVEGKGKDLVDVVVVVDAPEDVRIARVVGARAMDEVDVRARMRAQASASDRHAAADHVIDNAAGLDDLREQVDRLWADLEARAR
jgi:dephospho-CoA kinase